MTSSNFPHNRYFPPINASQTPKERREKYALLRQYFNAKLARQARDWKYAKIHLLIKYTGNLYECVNGEWRLK